MGLDVAGGVAPRAGARGDADTSGTLIPLSQVCVVVPAFNEEASVASVVAALHEAVPGAQVVVVDDASTDRTAVRARDAGADVVSLAVNLGIGGAVQTGYMHARNSDARIAVQVDGDGQHDPFEVLRLIDPIRRGRADMTVGSRWLGRGSYRAPSNRRAGMRILTAVVRLRCGERFSDTTSGFRAVGVEGIRMFAAQYPSDFPEVETLVTAHHRGLRLEEVPVSMRPREHGRSSIAGLRSAYYMARVILLLLTGQPRLSEAAE